METRTALKPVIAERITRDDGQPAAPDDLIDEVVVRDCTAHVEMMNERAAFMLLGDEAFWINCVKGRLQIRYSERRDPCPPPCDKAERGCVFVAGHEGFCVEPNAAAPERAGDSEGQR